MQYILTQEEYDDLKAKAKVAKGMPSKQSLMDFCQMVAKTVPVVGGWMDGKIWGCILDSDNEWYCDECPARKICPYDFKNWSK